MFVATPVLLGLLVTAGDWVPLILGDKWIAIVPLVQIVCIARLLSLSRSFAGPYITALGHPRSLLGPAVAGVSITIIALLFTGGLTAEFVVYAWAARLLVTIPASYYLLGTYAHVSLGFQVRPLLGPLFAAAIMVGSVMLWRSQADLSGWSFLVSEQLWRLCAEIVIGVLAFSASAALIYRQHIGRILAGGPSP
jgi:teichuronic acid exporter